MRKRKSPKKNHLCPLTEIKSGGTAVGGNGNRFAAFEFSSDDFEVEASARKTYSKFGLKSPKKKPAYTNSVDKYTFLSFFGRTVPQKNGSGKEPVKVDIKDDLLEDGAMLFPLPSPGTMFQSLSLSGKPGCSSRGTTKSCAYSSRNSGGHINEEKRMQKPTYSIDLYEHGRIDSQASTSFCLVKKEGSVGDRSSCPSFNGNDCEAVVIVSPNYIKYEDMHYRECSLIFTGGFIRMEGLPVRGKNKLFSLEWTTSDIVKIENRLRENAEADVLNLQFTFDHADADETSGKKSGVKELEFVIIDDPQWSKKQDEIKSLNVKYELAWETIISDCSTNEHFDGMAYPDDDPDSVSIRKSDVERLQPRTFLNDSIIDFYTKYLFIAIKPEEKRRFHFFNSFFFRKLADTDQGFSKTCDGQQAFQRVRKWTRNLELFEKDYIFIPINYSLHWSLIVICYPRTVANVKEKYNKGSSQRPCILHLDSLRGSHGGFENLIRSYLWEEWKEQHGNADAGIQARFLNLPFEALKVPQQENSYDCGIFLLEYAERFLEKEHYFSKKTYFSILNEALFLPTEVSIKKRDEIRRLIYKLAEETASKDPSSDIHHSSGVTEEDDSGIKVLDKETFEGLKSSNPCIDPQNKVVQSLVDMFEADKDENKTPCKSVMIGQMEVHLITPTVLSSVSPMIVDEGDEKDCVIQIGSASEKQNGEDVYSTISSQELADCVVEDSDDDDDYVVVSVTNPGRPSRYPQRRHCS